MEILDREKLYNILLVSHFDKFICIPYFGIILIYISFVKWNFIVFVLFNRNYTLIFENEILNS